MSAREIIEQIKHLPPTERALVSRYIREDLSSSPAATKVTVTTAADGLPIIRSDDGVITSDLVREIESQIP